MNRTLLLIIFYILCYPFLHSDGQVKAQVPSANASDSLTLLAFQKTLTEKGWPLLWDTSESKKLKDWDGVIVDLTTGVVNSLRVGYRSASDPVGFTADSIPPESLLLLKNMTGMKSLSFSVLGIKNIPREIGELIGLETLNLSYNQLSTLPPEINRLSQLKYLFLSNNLFADLPDISGLTQLVDLSLTLNRPLHRIPNAVFSLENLEELGVSFNRNITEIPEDISKLTKLKVLRANAMQLKELPDAIGSLPELEELLLSNNQLENLPESIGSLGKLKKLDLSINLLTGLPGSFINLTKLSGLNLSRNRLSSLPEDFSRLRFLQSLSLDDNRFGAIPSVLDDMGQLSLLSMKDNGLKGGIPEGILRLERRVILDNNELSGKIPLRNGRIPSWLHVSNNRFTLRDIEEHFHLFNSENPLEPLRDLRFQPQKRIGTFRTLRPAASASVSLSIEGYESLAGNVFTWYRYATLRDEARPVKVGSTEVLELPVFGPETEGGFYFCRVSNPRLKNLELESERIRVIGKDLAPVISAPDLRFREGQEGTLSIDIRDDFTVKGDLSITVPLETEHFLIELLPTDSNYRITAKSPAVYGTDSLTVSASDESGNTTERTIGITLLPIEN